MKEGSLIFLVCQLSSHAMEYMYWGLLRTAGGHHGQFQEMFLVDKDLNMVTLVTMLTDMSTQLL